MLSNTLVLRAVLLDEVLMRPTMMFAAMVTVLVLLVVQVVPLVELIIARLLPVRVTCTQQFDGVIEVDEVLVAEPPVLVRSNARMLLLPEPRWADIANMELALVVSRIITPASDAASVEL